MKRIVGLVRKAIEDYDMINEGDRMAVGVSGGKDSLVLLGALALLSRYYPKKFTVVGLTLDMGYDSDYSEIKKYCESFGTEYYVKKTNIKEVVFDYRNESLLSVRKIKKRSFGGLCLRTALHQNSVGTS